MGGLTPLVALIGPISIECPSHNGLKIIPCNCPRGLSAPPSVGSCCSLHSVSRCVHHHCLACWFSIQEAFLNRFLVSIHRRPFSRCWPPRQPTLTIPSHPNGAQSIFSTYPSAKPAIELAKAAWVQWNIVVFAICISPPTHIKPATGGFTEAGNSCLIRQPCTAFCVVVREVSFSIT